MRLGDIPEGGKFTRDGKEYEVVRQGISGTSVRPTSRIAKEVKGKRFASKARVQLYSSECAVDQVI